MEHIPVKVMAEIISEKESRWGQLKAYSVGGHFDHSAGQDSGVGRISTGMIQVVAVRNERIGKFISQISLQNRGVQNMKNGRLSRWRYKAILTGS